MQKIGLSLQKPKTKSYRKDDLQVAQWKTKHLPELKKAHEQEHLLLYADEASVSVASDVSHTYALIGKTPVIKLSTEANARLYMARAVRPKGDIVYMIRNRPSTGEAIVKFLEMLLEAFNDTFSAAT